MKSGIRTVGSEWTRSSLADLGRHGDVDAEPGLVDFAVNVRGSTPRFVREVLASRLDDLAGYPSADDEYRAVAAIADRHGRDPAEVLLLSGAAEGFALLPQLAPRRAALIQPSFTEPERALRAAGIEMDHVVLPEPWELDPRLVPDTADLVVLGNPTNPTSVLHPRAAIESLLRPGRVVVVDEAFADVVPGEPESFAGVRHSGVLVLRSITKTFALAGLRAGYLLGDPALLRRLSARRPHWPLGTLQLAALELCAGPQAARYAHEQAVSVATQRASMIEALRSAGLEVIGSPQGSFVLVAVADGTAVKNGLREHGYAVRSCANFVGLDADHLRFAVRDEDTVAGLIAALRKVI
ncbi:Rv2231c family pyridoxal phosphate-dependent protein CobC [Williamsia sp. 1138]|uniref:Rv2231c family pyridoxal phosphate-dependent protein CobC n=1 Tax=Williamsia sp. 1138 TaxID=1903117 RepID=UPI001FEE5346|nr:Rv2231c family pyridoxal phosphate-dependent protein CobC [Williamsia sp. 1138]